VIFELPSNSWQIMQVSTLMRAAAITYKISAGDGAESNVQSDYTC